VSFRLTQLPSLDGLRGIAILAVMLNNARYLPGGFLGVDIFFVLSGFLITALLLQEWQRTGTIRLGAFYARRAHRLLPALFALLAVVLLAPGLFYLAAPPWKDAAIAALYATNWVNALSLRNMAILDHTWSLPVALPDAGARKRSDRVDRGRGGATVGPCCGPARSRRDPGTNTAWRIVTTDRARQVLEAGPAV
jgi:hypothetical protein